KATQRKAWAKANDPERVAKIAAAKRGKHRPKHVLKRLREANLGRRHSDEVRRKMSEAHRKRGTRPPKAGRPWEAWEDALLSAPASFVIAQTGRSKQAVVDRRRKLQLLGTRQKQLVYR